MKRIPALDTLRAVAILWVITDHACDSFPLGPGLVARRFMEFGNAGVDLFFVLSGYLIAGLLLAEVRAAGRLDVLRFWGRRWLRTLPAYYATAALLYGLHLCGPAGEPWPKPLSYLVFLQPYANTPETLRFAWSWSLCTEEWFYLLLPPLLALARRLTGLSAAGALRAIAAGALVLSIVARLWLYHQVRGGMVPASELTWTNFLVPHYRLDGLAAGLFIATLPKPPATAWWAAGRVTAAVLVVGLAVVPRPEPLDLQRFVLLAPLFGVLVYSSAADGWWSRLRLPGARPIADLSYGLYLTHPIAEKVVVRSLPASNVLVQLAVFGVLCLVLSLTLRHAVELPFLRLRDRSRLAANGVPRPHPGGG